MLEVRDSCGSLSLVCVTGMYLMSTTRARTHTHARTRAHTHTHAHTRNTRIGCIVELLMLDDRTLNIPVSDVVCPGYSLRIRGEGMPITKGGKGDLVCFHCSFRARAHTHTHTHKHTHTHHIHTLPQPDHTQSQDYSRSKRIFLLCHLSDESRYSHCSHLSFSAPSHTFTLLAQTIQVLKFDVVYPTSLSENQKALVRQGLSSA